MSTDLVAKFEELLDACGTQWMSTLSLGLKTSYIMASDSSNVIIHKMRVIRKILESHPDLFTMRLITTTRLDGKVVQNMTWSLHPCKHPACIIRRAHEL